MDVNEGFHLTHVSRVYYGNAPVFVARQYGKPDKLPVFIIKEVYWYCERRYQT